MQGKTPLMLLCVLYAGAFLGGFNENLMNMALVSVMEEFSIGSVTAQWLVTGYMIVATVVVMSMAFLYRRIKLRNLFFLASGLSLVGSALGLFAVDFWTLLGARLIQAVGTGIFIPMMMTTILLVAPKNRLGAFISIGGCMITFGPAFSPVVCGAVVTGLGWHYVFAIPLVLTVILIILGAVFVKNFENDTTAKLDGLSVVLAAVFLFTLSFGLAELTSSLVLALASLGVAVATAAAFVVRQLRVENPLINLTPVKRITFWPTLLMTTVAMMSTFSLSVLLPLYYEGALGLTALMAGLVMLGPVLLNAVVTIIGGRVMDKVGEWPLLPLGFAAVACGFIALIFAAKSLSMPAVLAASLLTYCGVGMIFSPSQTAGLRTLPHEEHPHGVVLSTTFVQIAACIGPALFTGILSGVQGAQLGAGTSPEVAVAEGFSAAVIVAAVIAVVGFVTAFLYARAAVARRKAVAATEGISGAQTAQGEGTVSSSSAAVEDVRVAALMEPDAYTLPTTATVRDAMRMFIDKGVSGIVLVDDAGQGAGFLSDGDVMRYLAEQHPLITSPYSLMALSAQGSFDDRIRDLVDLPVADIAQSKLVSISADETVERAAELLAQRSLKKIPVTSDGRVVGVLTRSSLMRAAMSRMVG